MIRPCPTALLLIAAITIATPVEAQQRATTADVNGVVRDESGGTISGAVVTAIEAATQVERITNTDGSGRFVLAALAPGTYRIMAAHPGFTTAVLEEVRLTLGTLTQVELVLSIGVITQHVSVVARQSDVNPQVTALSTAILAEQVENLPINVRTFLSFSLLTPGVHRDVTPQQGASATSGLTFAGQRARSNNITVDGLDNNDSIVGSVRSTFSQEAVREFQVVSTGYTAEFGKASGGLVNIVTKSGTNDPGGTAFLFYRDQALSARNYFERYTPAGVPIETGKAPYRQQQVGAIYGGPVRRDRIFHFFSFEHLAIEASNVVTIDDTPTTLFGQPIASPVALLRREGFAIETGNVPYERGATLLLGKLDHYTDTRGTSSLRVSGTGERDENIEPWGGLVARSAGAFVRSRDVVGAASHTFVATPGMLNELRLQVAWRNQDVISFDPRCDGECDGNDEGGPSVEISGVATAGRHRFTPQPRENLRIQVVDTVSLYTGDHLVKAGVDYSYIHHPRQMLPLHFGGRFIFLSLPAIPGLLPAPISSIEAFALGLPAAYIQGYGDPSAPYATGDLSLFVQDDWRLAPNLTLKLGLRYQKQFWPDVVADVPGFGPYGFPGDNNNLAPRVAVSWDPRGDQRLAVHAAYGVYYDNHLTALPGINRILGGRGGVRTLALTFPQSVAAWQAPGRRLPEAAVAPFPSTLLPVGPELPTPYSHHLVAGLTRELPRRYTVAANVLFVRGFNQVAAIDYNPIIPALGPGRRPEDLPDPATGVPMAGTSASLLQGTSWGETSYRAVTISASKRLGDRYQLLASYTLAKAEDNSTDFQSAFLPEDNGLGRNPADPTGLPIGFDPSAEIGASLADRRHRFVASGTWMLPKQIRFSAIASVASGRPYQILAGADLNGDGDGGAFPSDRARRDPSDPASSLARNSGRMPLESVVDLRVSRRFPLGRTFGVEAIIDGFNVFNRTNFTEINNVFGTGAYPAAPLPTYGQFEGAGSPRQLQVGLKLTF